jgi:hypothetical protein
MSAAGIEYVLRDGVDLEAIGVALPTRFELATGPGWSSQRTFYDTSDGRLHARGLTLFHEDGRLALLDELQRELATVELSRRPRSVFASDLPEGRLREALVPIVGVRALSEIVRVRSRVLPARVLNADAKTVVRLFVEDPAALPPRLRLVGVRGYDKALMAIRHELEGKLGLEVAEEPISDEAVRRAGGVPGGLTSKVDLQLPAGQRADAAASVLLRSLLRIVEQNLPGAIADVDSEFLQERVRAPSGRETCFRSAAVFGSRGSDGRTPRLAASRTVATLSPVRARGGGEIRDPQLPARDG